MESNAEHHEALASTWLSVAEASRIYIASDTAIRQRAALGRLESRRELRDGREILVVKVADLARLFFQRDQVTESDRRGTTTRSAHPSFEHEREVVERAKSRAHRTASWMLQAIGTAVMGEAAINGLTTVLEASLESVFNTGGANPTDEDYVEDVDDRFLYSNFTTQRERLALAAEAGIFEGTSSDEIAEAWQDFYSQLPDVGAEELARFSKWEELEQVRRDAD